LSALLLGLLAAAAAWVLTWLAIEYAKLAQMHDVPGARRRHVQVTVRGAGIGFVAVIVAAWSGLGLAMGPGDPLGRWALCSALGIALVAAVSWIDDRRGLAVWPRLLTHAVAAGIVLFGAWPGLHTHYPLVVVLAVPVVLMLPAINFWNFIDGINGMAASQGVVVAAGLAALAWLATDLPAAWFGAIAAGAVIGFVPFNFPRARGFMGDVGSASLGLIVVCLSLIPLRPGGPPLEAGVLLAAVVFLDTGLTLLWRMVRRPPRRWYTAHREHLYQWLTRSGWSHTRSTLIYFAFSAGAASIVLLIGPQRPKHMLIAAIVFYLLGAVLWRFARDFALRRARVSR
jgi:UDP-N-acetylmuramyl pentapeptide phosphotransferase/UDP-N-acetylglucosamine-1-phosphate transferase